ncbi:hypothetical protein TIFTF001_007523 [Ficus carica]|uniref:Secreted protein n=1 Tax=Ficus carica TaxID=3494 RepID=A0AA87ZTF9_FICCA|nr:hypothetical protein TIFTF001_007523 [Ficus carica]
MSAVLVLLLLLPSSLSRASWRRFQRGRLLDGRRSFLKPFSRIVMTLFARPGDSTPTSLSLRLQRIFPTSAPPATRKPGRGRLLPSSA